MNDLIPKRTNAYAQEIASTRDGIDITRGYTGPLLHASDKVLQGRGGGDMQIYEQVRSHPQVETCLSQRQLAVIKCEWTVEPGGSRAIDKKAADHVTLQLKRIGFDERFRKMLFGVFYGFAVAEIMYDVQDNLLGWSAIKVRDRRRFRFSPEGELRMLTMANMWAGQTLPPGKFWTFATGADHDDEPYGLGLAHWCYWPVLFQRNGMKFWLTFLEKFGMPTGIGKYETNAAPEDQAKLLQAVQAIQSDSGIIVPKSMDIDLLAGGRSGTADYKTLHDTMDETIAKIILGQTMTSQDGSSQAQAKVHMDVRQDLVKADSDLVCESLNLGPIAWLTRYNFPDAEMPRVFRQVEEPDDLDALAERATKIHAMGFKPTLKYVQDNFGGEWTEGAPPTPPDTTPPANAADAPASFAVANEQPDAPQQMAELANTAIAPAVDAWVEQIRLIVEKADSLEAIRDGIDAMAPDMSFDQYATAMQQALTAATLAGRYDIMQEVGGASGG